MSANSNFLISFPRAGLRILRKDKADTPRKNTIEIGESYSNDLQNSISLHCAEFYTIRLIKDFPELIKIGSVSTSYCIMIKICVFHPHPFLVLPYSFAILNRQKFVGRSNQPTARCFSTICLFTIANNDHFRLVRTVRSSACQGIKKRHKNL